MSGIEWNHIFDLPLAIESFPYILQGVGFTILISFGGMAFGLVLGFILALGRTSKLLLFRWPSRIYISYMRGTPMLVFLFLLYFGLPNIGIQFTAVTAALIGFSLHSSAYMAEIIRSSLNSVDKGQWEASTALGFVIYAINVFRYHTSSDSHSYSAIVERYARFNQSIIVSGDDYST